MRSTMHELQAAETAARGYTQPEPPRAQALYRRLAAPTPDQAALLDGRRFLAHQFELAQSLQCELPEAPDALEQWVQRRAAEVGAAYARYLAERQAGAPRRYFRQRAHALNFLMRVAPTKLVDGSWLYSTLRQWRDPLYRPLILTYLEELGDGAGEMNHVAMYRELLAANDCAPDDTLSDEHFVQGAIQLALAYHGADMAAEVFGFNLGYEQLPLHLLITAYELNELGIDPYYFTLHVTIDNAASGHARKAATAVREAASLAADPAAFMRGVRRGYLLNELGASTLSVIGSFDAQEEVVAVLARKARFGSMMHSDYCRIGGKTVNQWLRDPASIRDFLAEMEKGKWIVRRAPAQQSRFWRLIDQAGGEMFGVFNGYEKQLLKDWLEEGHAGDQAGRTFRAQARRLAQGAQATPAAQGAALAGGGGTTPHVMASLDELIAELAPGRHHRAAGIEATRAFSALYRNGSAARLPALRQA